MNSWKKLQDLDLREVAARTQIEIDFLKALINQDFDTLNHFNVRGFIKILSREYDLDFTDFNELYENYLNENNLNNSYNLSKGKIITPKIDTYTNKSSGFWIYIIVAIIVILIFVFYYLSGFNFSLKTEENKSSAAIVNIIGEAKTNLKEVTNNVKIIDNTQEVDEEKSPKVEEKEENNLTNQDNFLDENTTINQEQNLSQEDNVTFQNDELNIIEEKPLDEVTFKTDGKIWVGLINLKNYKKTSFVKDKDFNLSLKEDQLVLMGASALSFIDEDGKEKRFPAGGSKRFLIKDGKISNITLSDFIKLNKGKEW
ncbi:hypothetical protein JG676_02865 [Campylobacter sp. 2018MI35]|uniref:hypothetical protein n=1 Tax=unclassified Campylobacter TaxID=2593542 RepID=UPI001907E7D3|nr:MULTISPECIES: hypothetical protein [unclassified Campylobacter]MBK1971916.1 hypothetical protein [Campylobacter sp. TTU_617]MBK1991541.1 hypothetical protein [Campylobacter sp. 2018MI34]